MMSAIFWEPLLPPALLAALGLLAFAITGWSFLTQFPKSSPGRAIGLAVLRLLAIALVLVMLFQPKRKIEEVSVVKPQLAVLLDTSESMTDPVDPNQPARAEAAKAWLDSEAFQKAREKFDVRLFRFADRLEEIPEIDTAKNVAFNGGSSVILGSTLQLADRFKGQPLQAVILLSDGQDTSGNAKDFTWTGQVPVFTFSLEKPFARPARQKRLSLSGVDFPGKVVVGTPVDVKFSVTASGMDGQVVPVQLRHGEKNLAETNLAFSGDEQTKEASFHVTPDTVGPWELELRVANEAADEDAKSHPIIIQVMQPGQRILYLQNSLSPDFKFIRRAISGNNGPAPDAFVRWADGQLAGVGSNAPAPEISTAGLTPYSIVILGDISSLKPSEFDALKDFVSRGGGLLVIGGPNFFPSPVLAASPLGKILPVTTPAPYENLTLPVAFTEDGLRHPALGQLFGKIAKLPPLLGVNVSAPSGAGSQVLIEGKTDKGPIPILATARYGDGRVVTVMTDTLWRWHLAATTRIDGRNPFDLLWGEIIKWLVPEMANRERVDIIDLFAERGNYLLGEPVEMRAIVRLGSGEPALPPTLPLKVKTPDGKTFEYQMSPGDVSVPGSAAVRGFRAKIEPNTTGVFVATTSATISGRPLTGEARFVVNRPSTEKTGEPENTAFLESLAKQSGGRHYQKDQADAWLDDIPFQEDNFTRITVEPLWNNPILLGFLIVIIGTEWYVRRQASLP